MTGAAAKALRPADARRLEGILRQLATLWKVPELVDIPVALNPRLSQTLGRLLGSPWRIGPDPCSDEEHVGAETARVTPGGTLA